MYEYRARVIKVVDADTIDVVELDLGFSIRLYASEQDYMRVRFAEIDAYETSLRGGTSPEEKLLGLEAAAWLRSEVLGRMVRLKSVVAPERGNFGRYLFYVFPDGDGPLDLDDSYNRELMRRGWAVPYSSR